MEAAEGYRCITSLSLHQNWTRCEELWETLVKARPDATDRSIDTDRAKTFAWFEQCLADLEAATQAQFFETKLLALAPDEMGEEGFSCFCAYFESINSAAGGLKKAMSGQIVSAIFFTFCYLKTNFLFIFFRLWND